MDIDAINQRIRDEAVNRLARASKYLANEIKVVLSVPAPRKLVKSGRNTTYYKATTKAISGAPPRKLTGRLRASIVDRVDRGTLTAMIGSNLVYAPVHEFGDHPYARVTLQRHREQIEAILAGETP